MTISNALPIITILALVGFIGWLYYSLAKDQRENRIIDERDIALKEKLYDIAEKQDNRRDAFYKNQLTVDDVRAMREALIQLGIERNSAQSPYGHLNEQGLTPPEASLDARLATWLDDHTKHERLDRKEDDHA